MKFFADEGVDAPIVKQLRQDGHDVDYVIELERSISDDEVLDRANRSEAILTTADKDFGELVFRQHRAQSGVILLRLAGVSVETKVRIVSSAIKEHEAELKFAFTVIEPGTVRIRRQNK